MLVKKVLIFMWFQLAVLSGLSRRHGVWGLDYTISMRLMFKYTVKMLFSALHYST